MLFQRGVNVAKKKSIPSEKLAPFHLLLQLLELSFRLVDLRLLCVHLLLELLLLLLSLLNLVADQGAADQTYDSTYAGSGTRIACSAADNCPETCAGTGPDDRALLGGSQRLCATEKKRLDRNY